MSITDWRPDFTKADPYAGMPPELADMVSKYYTLNPIQQAAAAAAAPWAAEAAKAQAAKSGTSGNSSSTSPASVYVADQQAAANAAAKAAAQKLNPIQQAAADSAAPWEAVQTGNKSAPPPAPAPPPPPAPPAPPPSQPAPAKTTPTKITTSIGGEGNEAPAGTVFNPSVPVNTPTPSTTTPAKTTKDNGDSNTSTTVSAGDGAINFMNYTGLTGNPVIDLPELNAHGADSFTIANYMAKYGQGWNYNYLVTVDDNSAMGKANKILKDAGISKAYHDVASGTGKYYEFKDPDNPNKTIQIPVTVYDNATHEQQFALMQKYGVISKDAKFVDNKDGTWGYTNIAPDNTVNGIPKDLYDDYVANKALYTKYGKPAPFFVDNTQHAEDGTAVVVVIPFDNPAHPLIVSVPDGIRYKFKNIDGNAVINQILNKSSSDVIIQTDAKGNFNPNDIATAINSGKLNRNNAVVLFGQDTVTQALQNATTMNILNDPKYNAGDGKYYIDKALADGAVTKAQLTAAGFDMGKATVSTKGIHDMDYISAHQEGTPNVQAAEPISYTSAKMPKGFIQFDSIMSQGQGKGYLATFTINGQSYTVNFNTYDAAKKYETKAQNANANFWTKTLSKLTGVPLSNEIVIQQDANKAHASALAKVISKVTGTPIQNVDVSPSGVMNFLNKPEVQLIGLGGAGALDEGLAVGNKTATAVVKALSSIPKPIVYATQAAMSGYSAYSTTVNWGSMTTEERELGIAGIIFPLVVVSASEMANMPKSSKVSLALDDYNNSVKVVSEKQATLRDTPETSSRYTTVRDEVLNAAADANTAKNRLQTVLDENGNTRLAKYVKNQIMTKSATEAGVAARELTVAEKALKTTYGTPTYDIAAADAQRAIANARMADQDFIDRISATDNLTTKQMKAYEKLSGYDGLAESVRDVNTASKELKAAWEDVDAGRLKIGKGGYVEAKLGSPEYLQNLERVTAAQVKLDAALTKYNNVITVRSHISPAAGYEGIINQTEDNISGAAREMSRLEAKIKAEGVESKANELHQEWLDTKNAVESNRQKLELLTKARDAGIPAPTTQKILSVKPTPEETQALIDEINKWKQTHLEESGDMGSSRTPPKPNPNTKTFDGLETQPETTKEGQAVATAKKPIEIKAPLEFEEKTELAPGEKLAETSGSKTAPAIVEEGNKAAKLNPLFTRKQQQYEPEQDTSKTERLGAMTPEQKQRLSAETRSTTWAVSPLRPIVSPAVDVIQKEFVTPKGDTISNFDPKVRDAIINITQAAVQNINKLQNQPNPVTNTQVKNSTDNLVKNKVDSITDTAIKEQVQPLAETITATAIKVQTVAPPQTITIPPPGGHTPPPPITPPINLSGHQKPSRIPNNAFGTVTWKQGAVWWARWYPYRQEDSVSLHQKPLDAVQVQNGNSAYDTIQTLTGMPPDKVPLFRMGFEDVTVKAPPHDPVIQNRESISFMRNVSARGRTMGLHHRPNDLGAGVVESKTKMGVRRHLKLV